MNRVKNSFVDWNYDAAVILTNVLKAKYDVYESLPDFNEEEITERYLRVLNLNQVLFDDVKKIVDDTNGIIKDLKILLNSQDISNMLLPQLAVLLNLKNKDFTDEKIKRTFFEKCLLNVDFTDIGETFKINSFEELYEFLKYMNIETEILPVVLDFYFDYENKIEYISKLIKYISDLVREKSIFISDIISHYYKNITFEDVRTVMVDNNSNLSSREITLSITAFNSLVYYNFIGVKSSSLYMGLFVKDLVLNKKKKEVVENIVSRLKAISDINRYKILKMASENPVYLQELSRELDMRPSTLSHHIQYLANERLLKVDIEQDNRKIYYSINKEMIENTIENLRDLIKEKKDNK